MKTRPDYVLHQVMDFYVIIGVGSDAYTPNEIMSLNESGAFLWHILEKGAAKEDLVESMLKEYETDRKTAETDVETFLNELREKALITE